MKNTAAVTAAGEIGRLMSNPVTQANAQTAAALGAIMKNTAAVTAAGEIGRLMSNPVTQANARIAEEMQRYKTEVAKFSSTIQDIARIRSAIPDSVRWNVSAAIDQVKNNSAISEKSLSKDASRSRSLVPNFDYKLPELPELRPVIDLPKMVEDQWERHNQLLHSQNRLLELQRDTYKILADDAKTNQESLEEQKRITRLTWAVLSAGVVTTFGIPLSVISQNWSLISDPRVIIAMLMLVLVWVIVIVYIKNGSLLPKKAKVDEREAGEQTAN
jgi:hypothetical protein